MVKSNEGGLETYVTEPEDRSNAKVVVFWSIVSTIHFPREVEARVPSLSFPFILHFETMLLFLLRKFHTRFIRN